MRTRALPRLALLSLALAACSETKIPAKIEAFVAMPTEIVSGRATTLSWSAKDATTCTIEPDVGTVLTMGSRAVRPTETTRYTLACLGDPSLPATRSTVIVNVLPADLTVRIEAFRVTPRELAAGETFTLVWLARNATSCSIDQGIGAVDERGMMMLTATSSTTFTMTCEGLEGPATATAMVTVRIPAQITSFSADATSTFEAATTTLRWSTDHASACEITPDVGDVAVPSGEIAVVVSSTTTYALACTGWRGTVTEELTVVAQRQPIRRAQGSATPDGASGEAAISADGRYVAFSSRATNLLPEDTDAIADVYLFDRVTGELELLSISSSGNKGNADSGKPSISADGRLVVFESLATNFGGGSSRPGSDVFLRDRDIGRTQLISLNPDTSAAGNAESNNPVISSDGRLIAFDSAASNLIANDTNGLRDVYVYIREQRRQQRISLTASGTQADGDSTNPALSADGRDVAFLSRARNLAEGTAEAMGVYVRNRVTSITTKVAEGPAFEYVTISGSGDTLLHQGEGRLVLYDVPTATRRVLFSSGALAPGELTGTLSFDARFVAFVHRIGTLLAIRVDDRTAGLSRTISIGADGAIADGNSLRPAISADGRYVAFESAATNLITGDANGLTDVFVAPNRLAP
jgi:Tol biopolymer transport system component